nr:LOW QUALITY PROTEIN: 5-methylcytosine rRNA methyltransferase NSUN4-like [Cherax quadricarinatus]
MLAITKWRIEQRLLVLHMQRRFKRKESQRKKTNTIRAQEYFDVAYPPVYGPRWPSIRLALLSKQKYVAVINNFANHELTVENFQDLGAVDIRHKYSIIADRMKASKKQKAQQVSEECEESFSEDQRDTEDSELIRPSLVKLDDDELAARAKVEPISRYPEEYQLRALAKDPTLGAAEFDNTSRVILPSEVGTRGTSIMMDYVPATKLKGLENWIEETDIFVQQGDREIGFITEKQEEPINLPSMLKVYAFAKGDISDFPQPKMDHHLKVLDYYALDGASLLPVLALDIQAGEKVLDLCAAPGGKTLIALQTILPGIVVSNDASESRGNRIRETLRQYIPHGISSFERHSVITKRKSRSECYEHKSRATFGQFKDQLSGSTTRGNVVYFTCTLSPLQNDGVVYLALSKLWQETTIECTIVDMSYAVRPLSFLYRFGTNLGLRYGQIVLPSLLNNFGPMYVAKIRRLR